MNVETIMTRKVMTLSRDQTLREALELFRQNRIRHAPILEDDRIVGLLTDGDLRRAQPSLLSGVRQEEFDRVLDETPVSRIMTRDPVTTTPDTSVKAVVKLLLSERYGALPVVEADRLVGIITNVDLLRALDRLL